MVDLFFHMLVKEINARVPVKRFVDLNYSAGALADPPGIFRVLQ